jgi:hypothetical protein
MKRILTLISIILTAASCDLASVAGIIDPSAPLEMDSIVEATFSITLNGQTFKAEGKEIRVSDLNGSASFSAYTNGNGEAKMTLPAGIYEASVSFQIKENNTTILVNGLKPSFEITTKGQNNIQIEVVLSRQSPLLIKEIYNGGCQKDDGSGSWDNDTYFILYNNSAEDVDASNICITAVGMNSQGDEMDKFTVNGQLSFAKEGFIPAWQAVWKFNRKVVIPPYSQIVIAAYSAIDHTQTFSNSVNLANSDYFAMYHPEIGFNHTKYSVPSNLISTDNYLKASRFDQTEAEAWTLSATSPALFIFEKENVHDYVTNIENQDKRAGVFGGARIPFEWIVDGVEIFTRGMDEDNKKRFTDHIDAGNVQYTIRHGHSVYRNVDKEATEAIEGNKGKLVYGYAGGTKDYDVTGGTTDPSGIDAEKSMANGAKIVYMDTNNSTNDFHERNFASLTGR